MRARIVNRPTRWVTYASIVLGGLVAGLCLVVVVYGAYLATFLELPKSDDHPPLRLYSGPFLLQPELLSGVRGESRQVREWIPLAQIPPQIIATVLTIEDHRFYSHFGIDPVAVGRALWTNFTNGGVVQGGSTITQQLAKNLFYSPQRTMGRKFKEALAALVLEVKYTKQSILESYLNEIYLGQAGFVSIYGVSEAAHRYLGKTLQGLKVEEVAMMEGLIRGPNGDASRKHPGVAKQ